MKRKTPSHVYNFSELHIFFRWTIPPGESPPWSNLSLYLCSQSASQLSQTAF